MPHSSAPSTTMIPRGRLAMMMGCNGAGGWRTACALQLSLRGCFYGRFFYIMPPEKICVDILDALGCTARGLFFGGIILSNYQIHRLRTLAYGRIRSSVRIVKGYTRAICDALATPTLAVCLPMGLTHGRAIIVLAVVKYEDKWLARLLFWQPVPSLLSVILQAVYSFHVCKTNSVDRNNVVLVN